MAVTTQDLVRKAAAIKSLAARLSVALADAAATDMEVSLTIGYEGGAMPGMQGPGSKPTSITVKTKLELAPEPESELEAQPAQG